jgi:hypothetical protein
MGLSKGRFCVLPVFDRTETAMRALHCAFYRRCSEPGSQRMRYRSTL